MRVPIVARRLARLAGEVTFEPLWKSRLSSYVYLHDFGKANRGLHSECCKLSSLKHQGDCLEAIVDIEFGEDARHIVFGGRCLQPQLNRDLVVA